MAPMPPPPPAGATPGATGGQGNKDKNVDPVAADKANVDRIKASIVGFKGHYTRALKAADDTMGFALANPSARATATLNERADKVEESYEKYIARYEDLLAAVSGDKKSWEDVNGLILGIEDRHTQFTGKFLQAIAKLNTPAANPAQQLPQGQMGANRGGGPTWKVQKELLPDKLTRDSTPQEMTRWMKTLGSFFRISGLQAAPVVDQQAFFFRAVDLDLETTVRQDIDDATPVFTPDGTQVKSLCSVLQDRFRIQYPLFTRRLEYFRYSQAPGQTFGDFNANLRQKGDEAELETLKTDDLYVFRVICGTVDKKLRERFLKLKNPTLKDLEEEATVHEMCRRSVKACDNAQGGGKSSAAAAVTPASCNQVSLDHLVGKCPRCGNKPHKGGSVKCPMMSKVCDNCQKSGHVARGPNGIIVCSQLLGGSGGAKTQNKAWKNKEKKKKKKQQESKAKSVEEASASSVMAIEDFNPTSGSCQPTPRVKVRVWHQFSQLNFYYDALPDTGATRTIISHAIIKEAGMARYVMKRGAKGVKLRVANGQFLQCEGTIPLWIESKAHGSMVLIHVLVSRDLVSQFLISWHDLCDLGVIPKGFPHSVDQVESVPVDSLEEIKADFDDVLCDTLDEACGVMKGKPMKITLKDNVPIKPLNVKTTRPVPVHFKEKADKLIDELLDSGVIKPVSGPSEWCSPAHFVPKGDGKKLRLVTDYRQLNKAVSRPTHPFPSAADLIKRVNPESRVFAKIDAVHGYFQVPLEEESSLMTTFLIPRGRFRYTGAPMGLCSSSDEFCYRTDNAVCGLAEYLLKIVDDMLVQARDYQELWVRLREVLSRCREAGIKISRTKLAAGREILFAGFIISDKGIKPNPEKVAAIANFPVPRDVSELRSFLGLANQLGHFVPDVSQITVLLRGLLKKDVAYTWLPAHQEAFENARVLLTSPMLVQPFNPSLKTKLLTDASRLHGLGFALLQFDAEEKLRLVCCGSRSLTSCQRNYATIELEALGIKWAIEKCHYYLRGSGHFTVITDHKPLLGIWEKPLADLHNDRLYKFREKLVDYSFDLEWTSGKSHLIADALSRAPVFPGEEDPDLNEQAQSFCQRIEECPATETLLHEAAHDEGYKLLIKHLSAGASPKSTSTLKPWAHVWDELSIHDDGVNPKLIVFEGRRIVVPSGARRAVLHVLHLAHAGIQKTYQNARQLYYWPGMKNEIVQMTQNCSACQALLPTHVREPLQQSHADGPMTHVATDLFHVHGQTWIVVVDRFSGFPWIRRLYNTDTASVVKVLLDVFLDWGMPKVIRSDGGPQFRSKFVEFCDRYGIVHELSSAYYPQSNGLAESAVKSMKHLLLKTKDSHEDFRFALLEWRNTPRQDGVSPAQAFLGRRQRTLLPALPDATVPDFAKCPDFQVAKDARQEARRVEKLQHDQHAREVPQPLSVGTKVVVQCPRTNRWVEKGVIESVTKNKRSYIILLSTGRTLRRNRRFVIADAANSASQPRSEDSVDADCKLQQNAHPSSSCPNSSSSSSDDRVSFAKKSADLQTRSCGTKQELRKSARLADQSKA